MDYEEGELPIKKIANRTVDVILEINDVDVSVVNDIDFTITLRMNLGMHWNEPRIVAFHSVNDGTDVKTPLDLKFLDHLWLPDLEILNLKQIHDYTILKKLAGIYFRRTTLCHIY